VLLHCYYCTLLIHSYYCTLVLQCYATLLYCTVTVLLIYCYYSTLVLQCYITLLYCSATTPIFFVYCYYSAVLYDILHYSEYKKRSNGRRDCSYGFLTNKKSKCEPLCILIKFRYEGTECPTYHPTDFQVEAFLKNAANLT
jgi:hypothetical protein